MSKNWNPLNDLMLLQDRMNRLFADASERQARVVGDENAAIDAADWYPAADVYEKETEFLIAVDLPGVQRSDLEIDLEDQRLVIRGTRAIENGGPQGHSARPQGKFIRSFTVPAEVDHDAIKADYRNGVLEIALPKRAERQSQRVQIKVQ